VLSSATRTKTTTQTHIRLRAILMQLEFVNQRSVRDALLSRLIQEAVAEHAVSTLYLYGVRGNEIFASLVVSLDWPTYNREVAGSVSGAFTQPPCVAVNFSGPGLAGASPDANPRSDCPVWRQAIEWFVEMVRARQLTLTWAVRFCKDNDSWCQRFGLVPSTLVHRLGNAPAHAIPHSALNELSASVTFSDILWPNSGGQ
jgi:hypothetical protein